MKEDDKLISKLLNETYEKADPAESAYKDNVVNLSDYFNRRETFYSAKSKGIESKESDFFYREYSGFRRILFQDIKIDIPKGLGLIQIDASFDEEIVFRITDETFQTVLSKTLAKTVTHLWFRGGNKGQFLKSAEVVDLRKKAA